MLKFTYFVLSVISITHIINPYPSSKGSENFIAQPICRESMIRAREEAKGIADVKLCAVFMHGQEHELPNAFEVLPSLNRSIVDYADTGMNRKLPVFADVLSAGYEFSNSDYIVYTNADIGVMPSFYKMIAHYAGKGYDAFAINRRRISGRFTNVEQLEEIYSEAGEKHTGYDTLVFKRDLFSKFNLQKVCIGVPFFDTALIHNFYAHANNFKLFTGKHLTFHIGMDLVKEWGDGQESAFNRKEFHTVLKDLYPKFQIEHFPGAGLPFFVRHFKWLMNPTFHYPTMLRLDISQLSHKRRKYPPREIKKFSYRIFNWLIRFVNFPDED